MSLVAFDLLELDGEEVAGGRCSSAKRGWPSWSPRSGDGIEFNEHIEGDGADIFKPACKLGHEGIVAKRKDLPYESGRSKRWLKIKNPDSPAVQRVRDETF